MKKLKLIYLIPIILLLIYLGIRLVDQSQITTTFPLDYTNDISSYITMTYFLDEYGIHKTITDWYYPEGFMTFDIIGPGWELFSYPFYKITNNLQIAAYITLVLMFILGFLIFLKLGKTLKLNKLQTIAFYCFYFISPMAIGDYVRQMRLPQMFAWIFMLLIFVIIFYYKNKKINKKFFIVSPLFALLIITHTAETILLAFLVSSLLIIKLKDIKQTTIIVSSFILGIILASPWLYTFITKVFTLKTAEQVQGWLLDFSNGFKFVNIFGTLISLALFITFTIYIFSIKTKTKRKKEILFFSPILFFNFLYLTKAIVLIPVLNVLYPDPILQFISFFTLLFFFKTNLNKKPIKIFYKSLLIIIPIIFILISTLHTPFFIQPTQKQTQSLEILNKIENPYIILGDFPTTFYKLAIVCYGTTNYNIKSAYGWSEIQITENQFNILEKAELDFKNKNCKELTNTLNKLKTTEIIAYEEQCNILEQCNFKQKANKGHLCLYTT